MKKAGILSLILTSSFILVACSSNVSNNSKSQKPSTTISKKSTVQSNTIDLKGKDIIEYKKLSYTKPEQLNNIIGTYKYNDSSNSNYNDSSNSNYGLVIFSDGRYIIYNAIEEEGTQTNYFDSKSVMQKKELNDNSYPKQVSLESSGRIIEKDGIYFLLELQPSTVLNILNTDGNQVFNQVFKDSDKIQGQKSLNKATKEIEDNNKGFIKDGKYYESKNEPSQNSWNKVENYNEYDANLKNATFKIYMNEKQYIKDYLESNSLNDLFYLTGWGMKSTIYDSNTSSIEIKSLTSEELQSAKGTEEPLKYGFKVLKNLNGEFVTATSYATDGKIIYKLKFDQLGIKAEEFASEKNSDNIFNSYN